MRRDSVIAIPLLIAALATGAIAATPIPLPDAGFEDVSDLDQSQWTRRSIGPPAEFSIDTAEKHGGDRSLKMRATESARSNIVSPPFDVAPGEIIHASAWVRCEDVPPDAGKIMLTAEWTDLGGHHEQASRIEIADIAKKGWQQIDGKITVPAGAALMRLRLGFVYSSGTIWWDDVSVAAEEPLVARVDLPTSRLSPYSGTLPVTILNRDEDETGRAVMFLRVDNNPAKELAFVLSGEPTQLLEVPLATLKPKKSVPLALTLEREKAPVFTAKLKVTVPPPIVLMPISPTHWAVEDGPPRLSGEIDLAVPKKQLHNGVLSIELVNADGTVLANWRNDTKEPPKDLTNPFELMPDDMTVGDYRVIATLTTETGKPLSAEQPFSVIHRAQASTTINERGFTVHGGEAILPLGIFNGGARVKEMGEAGFTVQHAYNAVNVAAGERPNDQAAKDFLDNAHATGLKCLFLIPRGLAFSGDWEGVRRRIRMFKNHPALLAWDEEEGLARGDLSPAGLKQLVSIIREEDPHHPIMIGDSRDLISRVTDRAHFLPVEQMDLGMWWWYPIPLNQGRDAALEGEERSNSLEMTPPSFLTLTKTNKPLWVGLQAYKKPQAWGRYPTPEEYRAQAYLALIHGAKGLMWYGGSVTGGMYAKPEEAHWPELKSLVRELRELSPVLTGETLERPEISPANSPISAMLKRADDGRTVLFAANRAAAQTEATLALSQGFKSARRLDGSQTFRLDNQAMSDTFEPYAVHIYELTP